MNKVIQSIIAICSFLGLISLIIVSMLGGFSKNESEILDTTTVLVIQIFGVIMALSFIVLGISVFILWQKYRNEND